jgi:hypothetical protein
MVLSDPIVNQYPALDERRMSPVAQKAVSRVFSSWNCSSEESSKLLGVSFERWQEISKGSYENDLNREQLLRASFLIGIFSGLQVFSGQTASLWPKLPNSGPLFLGRTPVEFMLDGGLAALEQVRDHVAALGF